MSLSPEDKVLRQQFKNVIARSVDGDQAKAEVLMQRISDRLGGYTHEEVIKMHPMPEDEE